MKGHITLQYIHSFDTVLEFLQSQGDKNERDLSLYEFRVYLTHQIEILQNLFIGVFGHFLFWDQISEVLFDIRDEDSIIDFLFSCSLFKL